MWLLFKAFKLDLESDHSYMLDIIIDQTFLFKNIKKKKKGFKLYFNLFIKYEIKFTTIKSSILVITN